jgi:hypothetical protein
MGDASPKPPPISKRRRRYAGRSAKLLERDDRISRTVEFAEAAITQRIFVEAGTPLYRAVPSAIESSDQLTAVAALRRFPDD